MNNLHRSFFAIFLLGLGSLISSPAVADTECKTEASLQINQQIAQVELAIDERTRRYGLMFRSSMGEHCGMLFIFDNTRPRVFTMRNTLIPLDIAFIDEEGRIGEILTMEPGGDRYPSSVAARYALEMNKGWFAANDIKVNDVIQLLGEADELQPLATVTSTKKNK